MDDGDDPEDPDHLPPRTIRSWHAHLVEPPGPHQPPPDDLADRRRVDEEDNAITLKNQHTLIVQIVTYFAAVPWSSFVEAWRTFDGSLQQLVKYQLAACADWIRAETDLDDPGVDGTASLYLYSQEREDSIRNLNKEDLEWVAAYVHLCVDGGPTGPSVGRVIQFALENAWCLEEGLPLGTPAGTKPPPQPPLWIPPPIPPGAVPPAAAREFFATVAKALFPDEPETATPET